jgi:hypothetical protein
VYNSVGTTLGLVFGTLEDAGMGCAVKNASRKIPCRNVGTSTDAFGFLFLMSLESGT